MNNPLNGMKKTGSMDVHGALPLGRGMYEPSVPRVALGFAGVAMTLITIAVSVILPAQMDSGASQPRMLAASTTAAPASLTLATVTRIDVVAAREVPSSTVPARIGEAAPQPARLGKTISPALVRVLSTNR